MLNLSSEWRNAFPGGMVGVLSISRVSNPKNNPELNVKKKELENELRARFSDASAIKTHPIIVTYQTYYKRFKKTYHVRQQVESIACKGKSIPNVSALVEAMFMAELDGMLITAGHDLDLVKLPLTLDVSRGGETYVGLSGKEQILKEGDMLISDREGILSSIIYGPDKRTCINPGTTNVLYTTYGVPGIEEDAMRKHLEGIAALARVFAPDGETTHLEIYRA